MSASGNPNASGNPRRFSLRDWQPHVDPKTLEFLALLSILVPSTFFFRDVHYPLLTRSAANDLIHQALEIFRAVRLMLESKNQLFFILLQAHSECLKCTGSATQKRAILKKWDEKFSAAFKSMDRWQSSRSDWVQHMYNLSAFLNIEISDNPFFEQDNPENVFWLINLINFLTLNGSDLLKIVELSDKTQFSQAVETIEKANCEDGKHLSEFFRTFAGLIPKFDHLFPSDKSEDDSSSSSDEFEDDSASSASSDESEDESASSASSSASSSDSSEEAADFAASSDESEEAADFAASSAQISSAIKKAVGSVDPDAAEVAGLVEYYEEKEDVKMMTGDIRMKLCEAIACLSFGWSCMDRTLLIYSIQYMHLPTSSVFYYSFFDGWYIAEIRHDNQRHLVVGSQNQEEFLQKLQRFVETLPESMWWKQHREEQLRLKEQEDQAK